LATVKNSKAKYGQAEQNLSLEPVKFTVKKVRENIELNHII